VTWRLRFTKQARKDALKLQAAGLRPQAEALLEALRDDPFKRMPPFEKLVGDIQGANSRRINVQHRLVSEVIPGKGAIKVLRMWTHQASANQRRINEPPTPASVQKMASFSTERVAANPSPAQCGLRFTAPRKHQPVPLDRPTTGPYAAARMPTPTEPSAHSSHRPQPDPSP
jgi:toxin YoeB